MLAAGTDDDANYNNIIFTIKDTKIYVSVVTLSANDNSKVSKLLSKGFEASVSGMDIKEKVKRKIQHMNINIFSNRILLDFNLIDCLLLFI